MSDSTHCAPLCISTLHHHSLVHAAHCVTSPADHKLLLHAPPCVQDPQATLGRLLEFLNQHYPSAVPPSTVWGFGRPLWDPSVRVYGQRPLRVVVLGPAASGKSTQCELLAARWAAARGHNATNWSGLCS